MSWAISVRVWCRIDAVQIRAFIALADVPTNVLVLRFCLKALKKLDSPSINVDVGDHSGAKLHMAYEERRHTASTVALTPAEY